MYCKQGLSCQLEACSSLTRQQLRLDSGSWLRCEQPPPKEEETWHGLCMQVWSVMPLPDGSGFVSCSADHAVKFWEWEILGADAGQGGPSAGSGGSRRLSARHARTLKMSDDVLCVRVSPDGRLIAAALLDSTIQVRHCPSQLLVAHRRLPGGWCQDTADGQAVPEPSTTVKDMFLSRMRTLKQCRCTSWTA